MNNCENCIEGRPRIGRLAGVTRTMRLALYEGEGVPEGTPQDLTGLTVVVRVLRDGTNDIYTPEFVIEGTDSNVIKFTWPADQQAVGNYTIDVTLTDGSDNVNRVNWHGKDGIRLVEYSNQVYGDDATGAESSEAVGLVGYYTTNGVGMSAYEEWLASDESQGYPQTMEGYMQWQQHAATEAAAEVLAELGSRDGSAAGDGTMWGDYKSAEAQRNTDYGTAEEHRDGEYATAEAARDTLYGTAEGTSGSAAGNGSRWGAYKTAENSRDGEYSSAEGHRDSEYSTAEEHRDGEYATAEAARDTLYGQAEGTASSAAGSNNRWGSYKTAEAARNTARETAEGTAASSAGDGTRWGAYKTAEAARNTARENAEGTASSTAGDGTRWGAYKAAEAARGEAYNAAEGTESGSVAGDGSRWGAYKTAEAARSEQLNDLEAEVNQLGQELSSEMGSVRFSRLGFVDETNINPTTGDDAYNAKVISSSIYTPINGSVIYINDKSQVAGRSLRYAVAYYDASKNFIERTDVSTATIYSVPQGAKLFRIAISLYINGQSVGGHKQDYDLENVFSYDNASLKSYLDDLDEQVHDLAEGDALVEITSFNSGGYINTEDSTINVNDGVPIATSSSSYRYAVIPCSPGDSFVINAKATRVQAPWCFADASFNVINKTQIGSETAVIIEWDNIVAPENAAWLIINDQNTGKPNYKGKTILGDARKIVSELSREIGRYDNSIFEIGNISIQTNGLNYTNNTSRARTKEGKYIHLRVGDIINFGDSDIRFYVGWFNGQGWSSQGWITTGTYTIEYESDYVLLVRKSDNSVLASVDDGFGSFYITRANGKQDQLKSGVSIKTINGKSVLGYGNVEIGLRNVYVKRPLRSIAHRGCHILLEPTTHHIPESSVQSFIQAAKQGFDTIECDIQYTSDGVPVIFHDMTINAVARNPDGTEISEQVSITGTSYEVLMQYDFGIKWGQEYAGTKLLTLSQAVDVCKKLGMDFMPQVKAGFTTQRAKDVVDIVAGYDMLDNCIWQGLDGVYSYLTTMYNYNNNLVFLLLAPNGITNTLINNAKAIRNTNNQVYIGVDYTLLTDAMIQLCQSDNIPLMLWTVNDGSYILNSISPYVCGVMSDSIAAQKLLKDNLISQAVE